MDIIGRTIANRYEIISKTGVGGMATVYVARDKVLNRDVAVDKENIKDEVREFMDQYTTVHYSFSQNEGYRFHKL